MVEALEMPEALISKWVETVKGDAELWRQIKDREIDIEENGRSDRHQLVFWSIGKMVEKETGDCRYSVGTLVITLRREARKELGLRV